MAVIHNMVTALLEYLNLLAVFPEAYLILSISILAMQNKLSYGSQTPIFTNFPYFPRILLFAFSLLFLKKITRFFY